MYSHAACGLVRLCSFVVPPLASAVDRLRQIWPAVKGVAPSSFTEMRLDVGEVACIVTCDCNSFLWNVEHLPASARAGLHMFLCAVRGECLTTFPAKSVAVDTLDAGHWMLLGFARLQDPRWGAFSSTSGSAVFHDLLRFAVDCDFDNIVVDVAGGGITMKTAPLYRKYRRHAVVVLDPCRRSWNLTRRCTRAKVQEIKTRLRHIMARLEVDPKSFWWEPHVSSLWLPRCSTLPTELDWDIPRQIRSHRVPLAYGPLEWRAPLPVPGSSGPPPQKQPRRIPPMPPWVCEEPPPQEPFLLEPPPKRVPPSLQTLFYKARRFRVPFTFPPCIQVCDNLPVPSAWGYVSMRCVYMGHAFVIALPLAYTLPRPVPRHVVIHIAGHECNAAGTGLPVKPAPWALRFFRKFARLFVAEPDCPLPCIDFREWLSGLADALRPSFSSMALVGLGRSATRLASQLAISRPLMFRCLFLLDIRRINMSDPRAELLCASVPTIWVVKSMRPDMDENNEIMFPEDFQWLEFIQVLAQEVNMVVFNIGQGWEDFATMFSSGHCREGDRNLLENLYSTLLDV